MADIDFVSSQGLAGFMELGFISEGFKLQHRTGTLEFGNPLVDKNRHLMGDDWDYHFSPDPSNWKVPQKHIPLVVGLPPCSGWSCWTGPANRGPDAKAHEHTKAFMRYVGRVKPEVAVFECVQQAYNQGRESMQKYREMVEEVSGERYDLHHVKMNNLMVGGYSYRPRYFWVATKEGMPFTASATWPDKVPTILDTIGDLAVLDDTWGAQSYQAPASPYVSGKLSESGQLDGHKTRENLHMTRIAETLDWLNRAGEPWLWGEGLSTALQRVHDKYGELPPSWESKSEKIIARKFDMGFSLPYRWPGNVWANVLTGGCLDMVVHPTRDRCLTHREAARIQGLPDDWKIEPAKSYSALPDTWGKAVSYDAGKWIAGYVRKTLEGTTTAADQNETGQLIGDREWLHETDKGFSRQKARARYFPGTKGGITRAYNPELWPWAKITAEPELVEEPVAS